MDHIIREKIRQEQRKALNFFQEELSLLKLSILDDNQPSVSLLRKAKHTMKQSVSVAMQFMFSILP